jgi:polar amino acid transport system permease protein
MTWDSGSKDTEGAVVAVLPARPTVWSRIFRVPWWALVLVLVGIWIAVSIAADPVYSNIFRQLRAGVEMTLRVSGISYALALVIGLVVGIIRSSPPQPQKGLVNGTLSFIRLMVYNAATLFVEVMRGLPVVIVLLISAFVIVPAFRAFMMDAYGIEIAFRGASPETAIMGLSLLYGAFLSEIFRAGIQSIGKGQIEAARSLGMNYLQVMRYIVLPQAVRRVLPPLGNDFISLIKDSSLVTVLGIRDVTQIARLTAGSSFLYLETYLTVAVIYLSLTLIGSMLVRLLERRFQQVTR